MPKMQDFAKEAAILIGGALLAAFVMSQFPALRTYIKNGWDGADRKV
jgi:hypothetical protein